MNSNTIKKWLVLGGLLALTLWLVVNMPEPEIDAVVNPVKSSKQHGQKQVPVQSQNVGLNTQISLDERFPITDKPVDLFGLEQEIKPKQKIKLVVKLKSVPKAPPLPFTYIGKLVENDLVKLFLLEDQALHIVKKGDKIGNNYQLKSIDDQQISWLYLPLNITQNMSIGKAP